MPADSTDIYDTLLSTYNTIFLFFVCSHYIFFHVEALILHSLGGELFTKVQKLVGFDRDFYIHSSAEIRYRKRLRMLAVRWFVGTVLYIDSTETSSVRGWRPINNDQRQEGHDVSAIRSIVPHSLIPLIPPPI